MYTKQEALELVSKLTAELYELSITSPQNQNIISALIENETALKHLDNLPQNQEFQVRKHSIEFKLNFIDIDGNQHRIFENNGVFINNNITIYQGASNRRKRSDILERDFININCVFKGEVGVEALYLI